MTITLLGSAEDCQRAAAILRTVPELEVERSTDLVGVADGSGRFRVYLTVTVGA